MPATVMLAVPTTGSAVGVKVAMRVSPSPLSAPRLPPTTAMSPASKLPSGSSLKAKLISAVSPALSAGLLLVMSSVGATVSIFSAGVLPAAPALPAASVYSPAATVMLAAPLDSLGVGVKVAVRVSPLPLIASSVPPVTAMSARMKLLPGSSLKLKVMPALTSALTAGALLVITNVGASVSILTPGVSPAAPALPAASA